MLCRESGFLINQLRSKDRSVYSPNPRSQRPGTRLAGRTPLYEMKRAPAVSYLGPVEIIFSAGDRTGSSCSKVISASLYRRSSARGQSSEVRALQIDGRLTDTNKQAHQALPGPDLHPPPFQSHS
ncbi:hypothetical protein SKAU_G00383440 [Synaphobranchus kaupii]|uniref:Uncharacterized protein n=1 Tax=Synaphobranchus kaupii TaxID=118154 RepID=A0A9Q1IEW8_SYNKA|nr:hypothetical protein SKAU_G00383440 [Synaphobranchus kaupii]